MTAGLYSPLPPAPTGVADYSAALFASLRNHGTILIAPDTCDIDLYHIGNNPLHFAVYRRALAKPGVVVLHDALLTHFYLGLFTEAEFIREFVYNYGEWAREEAAVLWRNRTLSAQDPRFFQRPMLKRIASTARAVIVHNPAAARAVREHSPETPVFEVPHFYEPFPPPGPGSIAQFRASLNIPANGFVFSIFGFLREPKRLLPILNAFHKLHRFRPETRLLVAGEFVSQNLARAASALLRHPAICRLPHLPEPQFQLAVYATDCCLNLRYPTAGETSGIAMRLMGAGKSVIVTEGEEWARIPELALFRIPPGPPESAALFSAMALFSHRPDLSRQMGLQAAQHIQRYHSLSASASDYWKILCCTFESASC